MRKARDADVYWSTLGIAERSASGSAPTKTRVLTRKAHGADVRGAGLWPTGVHEAPWNATREVPHPLKRGFSSARRPEAMRTGVREPLENAADEVPQLTTCGLALQDREART